MNLLFSGRMAIAKITVGLLSCVGITAMKPLAECDASAYSNVCISRLGEGFNYLKSYRIDGEGREKVEYSYVFSKGTQYMLNLCSSDPATEGIVITLFDSDRNKVASSKVNGQRVSAMAYLCHATGIYYIQYTFEGPTTCAVSTLGFKHEQ